MEGRILKFENINEEHSFTLEPVTGLYVSSLDSNNKKGLYDFLCDPDYIITKVKYGTINPREFELLEFVKYNNNRVQIDGFTIIKNKMYIATEDDNGPDDGLIHIALAIPYINNQQLIDEANQFFTQLQQTILDSNPRKFRILGVLKNRRESVKEFLIKFFKGTGNMTQGWNNSKNTIYLDNSEVQTESGRRRSLGDIFIVLRYYYPNITLKEVVKLLYVTLPEELRGNNGLRSSYCNQINKRVWYCENNANGNWYNTELPDEYNNTTAIYKKYITNSELTQQ